MAVLGVVALLSFALGKQYLLQKMPMNQRCVTVPVVFENFFANCVDVEKNSDKLLWVYRTEEPKTYPDNGTGV
jgi:hypothetical protein